MGNYTNDSRIVLTLDAGGTNMVFGAMKGEEYVGEPITLPANANDLDLCLKTMVVGFESVMNTLSEKPVAISFAFPGPADYPNGIIGGYLPNFPSFRDGVALGPFLEEKFGVPVFINNDGDLYAFGEALGGALPAVNEKLAALGSAKRYHNLIGYTFGTGFGIGCVINGQLNRGDNSCVETYCLPHSRIDGVIVEDGVAVRAVKRVYAERSGVNDPSLTPKDIYDIAEGKRPGNPEAAKAAFAEMGTVAGNAMALAAQLMDGLIVIGGGITASKKYFMPSLLEALRGTVRTLSGDTLQKLQMKVYNLDDEAEFAAFAKGDARELKVYGSDKTVTYDPQKRIGVMISRIGASKAISVGAYDFALAQLDA
ncbi:MAG: ROK family protein [Bacteroidales bacterium]|jgi:predicted NBD/HSP70 family sugar kinase|nr:ROK family protein [Bacteroidales bacterium]